jgi:hypothetical protein
MTKTVFPLEIATKLAFVALLLELIAPSASAQTGRATATTQSTNAVPGGFREGHILVKFKAAQAQTVLDQLTNASARKLLAR